MFRPYTPQDAAAFLRLLNLARGQDTRLEPFVQQDETWPAHRLRQRLVAVDGAVVGMAELRHYEYHPAGWPLLTLAVDPDARTRGLGTGLLNWALSQAGALQVAGQVAGVGGTVLDHDPHSRAWAERRGFVQHAHRFASQLDLSRAQPAPQPPEGVVLRDMTAATDAEWERLETLYGDFLLQTPDLGDQPRWTPEQLRAHTRDNPRGRPEWTLVAVGEAGEWLGLCQGVQISTGIYNELTGVVEAARGRGLARALKLDLIRRARAAGVGLMRTNNHAENAPMLSVNRRLGFEPLRGSWEMRLKLT